jgi:hypothetical protein
MESPSAQDLEGSANNAVSTPVQVNPVPDATPACAVSATIAVAAAPSLLMLATPMIVEFRIVNDPLLIRPMLLRAPQVTVMVTLFIVGDERESCITPWC